MNFKNFYDTYYAEEYTSGEFTFGFELEGFHQDTEELLGVLNEYFPDNNNKLKEDGSVGNITGDCPDCDGYGSVDGDDCETCHGTGGIPTEKKCSGETFEWASPVLKFNPATLSHVVKLFKELNSNEKFDVNESCGFHVHIGTPNKFNVQEDLFWVLCCIATSDPSVLQRFKRFGNWNFVSDDYASTRALTELRDAFKRNNLQYVRELFSEDKYRVFRIHPLGTIEWRGPRGFVINNDQVKKFFLSLLPDLINVFKKAMVTKSITVGEYTYTKQQIVELVSSKARNMEYAYKNSLNSSKRFSSQIGANKVKQYLEKYPWLKKAQFIRLYCSETDDKKNLIVSQGIWLSGDCYGVIDGSLAWQAPKECMKGEWASGYIHGQYAGVSGGEKFFGRETFHGYNHDDDDDGIVVSAAHDYDNADTIDDLLYH